MNMKYLGKKKLDKKKIITIDMNLPKMRQLNRMEASNNVKDFESYDKMEMLP